MLRYLITILIVIFNLADGQDIPSEKDAVSGDRITLTFRDSTCVFFKTTKRKPVKVNKIYYWFKGGKIISTEGDYSGELLHGTYTSFFDNKQLKAKGNYFYGIKQGVWKYWDTNGKLLYIVKHKKNGDIKNVLNSKNITMNKKEKSTSKRYENKKQTKNESTKSKKSEFKKSKGNNEKIEMKLPKDEKGNQDLNPTTPPADLPKKEENFDKNQKKELKKP